jgi:hypothetical protein
LSGEPPLPLDRASIIYPHNKRIRIVAIRIIIPIDKSDLYGGIVGNMFDIKYYFFFIGCTVDQVEELGLRFKTACEEDEQ